MRSNDRLCKGPTTQLNVRVPESLASKLERLCAAVDDHGGGVVSRKEVVAALLFSAPESGEQLVGLMTEYRRAPADAGAPESG